MDCPKTNRPSSFIRFSRSFFSIPIFLKTPRGSSKSNPVSRFMSPRETPSSNSISPTTESLASTLAPALSYTGIGPPPYTPLLRPDEIKLVSQTLNKTLKEVDFGNEVVIRLLNDKRSLFKSLLARCAAQAHEIEVFDAQSLARFCPRAVQVGDGVSRFFERVAIVLEKDFVCSQELEEKLSEMCRANGQMHYRMKVWFQAENWLCVKHSVVDTVLMANSNLKREKQLKSAGDLSQQPPRQRRCLNRIETLGEAGGRNNNEKQSIEVVWMKLMQAVITWMKQGFLEAALIGREEQDEEL